MLHSLRAYNRLESGQGVDVTSMEDYETATIKVPFPVLCSMHCSLKQCDMFFFLDKDKFCYIYQFPNDIDRLNIKPGEAKPVYVKTNLLDKVVETLALEVKPDTHSSLPIVHRL